jgi:methyl-accepting chemotaxis protein
MAPESTTTRKRNEAGSIRVGEHEAFQTKSSHSPLRHFWRKARLPVIFGIMALVAVAVNAKFIFEPVAQRTGRVESGNVDTVKEKQGTRTLTESQGLEPETRFTGRALLPLVVTVACFGSILFLFVTRIVMPLDGIIEAIKKLAQGNLRVTVSTNSQDELKELGQSINDLAANLQEVLLFTGTAVGNACSEIEKIESRLEQYSEAAYTGALRDDLEGIKTNLEMVASMVMDFKYYQTRFDGRKVVRLDSESDS